MADVTGSRQPRPTLRTVADAAGVSISTASLVFSARGPVAAETAERVRAAAAQLGYAGPDPLAASLRQGRTGVVGVVVEGRMRYAFSDPFAVSLLDGLVQALDELPASMLLIANATEDPQRALQHLSATRLDAAVFCLCAPDRNPAVEHLASRGIPMVGDGSPADERVAKLRIDNRGATADLARHLRELGHRRVGHVAMPLEPGAQAAPVTPADLPAAAYHDARDRALGFLDVFPDGPMVQASMTGMTEGAEAARRLLDVPPHRRPTAIVAQSDLLAMGTVRAATDLGLRVPDDLSVTGFDGIELPWFPGVLTTVLQHGEEKGRRLGAMVCAAISGETPEDRDLPLEVRLGTTTAPPPAS
jgi:DNA-binding LacI/PurR family transcriptional regulator